MPRFITSGLLLQNLQNPAESCRIQDTDLTEGNCIVWREVLGFWRQFTSFACGRGCVQNPRHRPCRGQLHSLEGGTRILATVFFHRMRPKLRVRRIPPKSRPLSPTTKNPRHRPCRGQLHSLEGGNRILATVYFLRMRPKLRVRRIPPKSRPLSPTTILHAARLMLSLIRCQHNQRAKCFCQINYSVKLSTSLD